jgi:endo-1,4-beta-D-glucanase Y
MIHPASLIKILALLLSLVATGLQVNAQPSLYLSSRNSDWTAYKTAFVLENGRVVDDANGGISHSESQGYGMILALFFNDRPTFDLIYQWTVNNLRVRDDGLYAWRWSPAEGDTFSLEGSVTDENNATDGDILIAWALLAAGENWDESYLTEGIKLVRKIRRHTIRYTAYGPIILPGVEGFETDDAAVINLSYWVFPAFAFFARYDQPSVWQEVERTGLRLLELSTFGDFSLVPDWTEIRYRRLTPAPGFPSVFGYNAVRIPLYLIWAGRGDNRHFAGYERFIRAHNQSATIPAEIDVVRNHPGPYPALRGMLAIYELMDRVIHNRRNFSIIQAFEPASGEESYYSTTLRLLSSAAFFINSN